MTQRYKSGSAFEREFGYSRAVEEDRWIFVAGTTGFDYKTMTISPDAVEQCEQCFRNIAAALGFFGASLHDVVRVHYIVPNRDDFARCGPVLRKHFGSSGPAATMLAAGLLDERIKIEIEVTARRPPHPD